MHVRVRYLSILGGWFGIRGLQEVLSPELQRNWERAWRRPPANDLLFESPLYTALRQLKVLLPESPTWPGVVGPPWSARELAVAQVNAWIREHQADLEKLEPTGEGVDFSAKACKDGKPVGLARPR